MKEGISTRHLGFVSLLFLLQLSGRLLQIEGQLGFRLDELCQILRRVGARKPESLCRKDATWQLEGHAPL